MKNNEGFKMVEKRVDKLLPLATVLHSAFNKYKEIKWCSYTPHPIAVYYLGDSIFITCRHKQSLCRYWASLAAPSDMEEWKGKS